MSKIRKQENQSSISADPTTLLQAAIEKIEAFTQQDAVSLEMQADGSLVALSATPLEKVISLARSYVQPIFSDQARQKQEYKLNQLKKHILEARDIIQSHSLLIERLQEGGPQQQHLVKRALEAIKRYNMFVQSPSKDSSWSSRYQLYNYERQRLLLDKEIKDSQIRLPYAVSLKYETHLQNHPAQKQFQVLSQALMQVADKKPYLAIHSTHKKTIQVMMDAFRLKAVRMLSNSELTKYHALAEIYHLVNQTAVKVYEDETFDFILSQVLHFAPGSSVIIMATSKKTSSDSKLMSIPVLANLHFSFQTIQKGFPYPAHYIGWALTDEYVDAMPLRLDQLPDFQALENKKQPLAQALLFDPVVIAKAKQLAQLNKKVFDLHRTHFLQLHRELHEQIIQEAGLIGQEVHDLLDKFYMEVEGSPSAFDALVSIQQQLLDLYVHRPAKKLQEKWMEGDSALRQGSYQEKLQRAALLMQDERDLAEASLDLQQIQHQWIAMMGSILGRSSQSIVLQYFSEKIGFAPPMLTDFERKLQISAFEQQIRFLENLDKDLCEQTIKEDVEKNYIKQLKIVKSESIDELDGLPTRIVINLEQYFNSRYYGLSHSEEMR